MQIQYPPVSPAYAKIATTYYTKALLPAAISTGARGYNSSFYTGNAPGNTGTSVTITRGRRRGLFVLTSPGT